MFFTKAVKQIYICMTTRANKHCPLHQSCLKSSLRSCPLPISQTSVTATYKNVVIVTQEVTKSFFLTHAIVDEVIRDMIEDRKKFHDLLGG